jgi:putative membrane protein
MLEWSLTGSYCGPSVEPAALLTAWNTDPFLLAALLATGALFWRLDRRWGNAGTALLFLAFVSPLCALSVSLFSARALHHVVLIAIAAPCLAMALRKGGRAQKPCLSALPASLLHAVVLWGWHVPAAYEAALANVAVYWIMEISLLMSSLLLWQAALSSRARLGSSLALLSTMMQMGLLGALLTFAGRPLYAPHFGTTLPYGLSPLADQQLAGLIMWVPGALPYLVAGVFCMLPLLTDAKARTA